MSATPIDAARRALMTLPAAKAKHAELTETFQLAKSEYDRGTATGATWPELAAKGLERWGDRLVLAGKWLLYAERDGALFDERRIAIEAAKAAYQAALDAQSNGTDDPKKALELEQAVIVARAALYHTTGSFPFIPSMIIAGTTAIDRAERGAPDRVQYALGEAVGHLLALGVDRSHAQARAHLGILRADATPARRMLTEPLRKTADRLLEHVPEGLREAFAVVALEEVGRYRAACAKFDPDDRNRDGTKKGTPHVDPPAPEELAKYMARFFEHQEEIDRQKAKHALDEKKKIQAKQAARELEMRKRSEFRASGETSSATWEGKQRAASPEPFDEKKHEAGAPPMPAPPPTSGRTV